MPCYVARVAVHTSEIRLSTPGHSDIVDITRRVQAAVAESGTTDGQASAFVRGSTAGITTMEFEPGGVHDLRALLDRLIPVRGDCEHSRLNRHETRTRTSAASIVGASEVVPVEAAAWRSGPGSSWSSSTSTTARASDDRDPGALVTGEAGGPHPVTASRAQGADRVGAHGRPFLAYRDAEGERHLLSIESGVTELWVGRSPSSDVRLSWDEEVSALRAQLEVVGNELTVVDEGLSRNGSFVNGERVSGRSRLRDGDMLRFGQTMVLFRAPALTEAASTVVASDALSAAAGVAGPASRAGRALPAVQGRRRIRDAAYEPTALGRAPPER
jgi:thiamine phosphate synthase YjbQ (UPF0047 family)